MQRTAITIRRSLDEVRTAWQQSERLSQLGDGIGFTVAPRDQGTEVLVTLDSDPAGGIVQLLSTLFGSEPMLELKEELRRFKQVLETGEVARSDGNPDGASAGRLLHQEDAEPGSLRETAGA